MQKIKITSEKSSSKFTEIIRGIKDIKSFEIKDEIIKSNISINQIFAEQNIKRTTTFEFLSRVKTFIQWIIDAILVLLCAFWLFPTKQITVVALLIILNYKNLMYDTVGFFSKVSSYYVNRDYQAGKILKIIKSNSDETFGKTDIKLNKDSTLIVQNFTFAYEENINILDNISFKLSPRTCSVFIGSSGSGKSILFGVLTKLIDIPNSKVFFGDYDINNFSEESFRNIICIVNQEPFIFNDTILNNILVVKPDSTLNEVETVCKKLIFTMKSLQCKMATTLCWLTNRPVLWIRKIKPSF